MQAAAFKVIDCDIHNHYRSYEELLPYLQEPWRNYVAKFGVQGRITYTTAIGLMRKDSVPPGGGQPGSDPEFMSEQLFEPYNLEYGILNGDSIIHLSTNPDPDYSAAVASAWNDYLIDQWLPKNKKFKGAVNITTQDPSLAAREIDRVGPHPDMVQVIMAGGSRMPYGQRFFHPIYEACERQGLPIAIHPGSEGGGINNPPTSAGYVTNYLQWHTSISQTFMAHLISLVCDGVFEKFPNLKVVLTEGGVSWLPHLMWRLDKNYKALRIQAPWLKKMPSEYIREHCYFTTQPIEEPEDFEHLRQIFNMIDAENILLFSSDYPHWDFDDPTAILKRLSPEVKHKIFYENAKQLYKL